MQNANITTQVISLLRELISTPSQSGNEDKTAMLIKNFIEMHAEEVHREGNNLWVRNKYFDQKLPTILLNSHHDTVKPNAGWTIDPYTPLEKNGKLFGLGSNDAGGALVSLLATFLHFYQNKNLKYNLIYSATAEEETSGANGIKSILPHLGEIDMAIVGEPTGMQMAVAEKGLMVIHCRVTGIAGHAARDTGENAIYKAMKDVEWFRSYKFPRLSKRLGPVKMTVTGIKAGIQHNIIPDSCTYMVDIRSTEAYTHPEILNTIKENISAEIERCSNDLNPSSVPDDHILVQAAGKLDIPIFASPTLSDQALISAPSIKIGPGNSERSHTADEFIYLKEIEQGIEIYIQLLDFLLK